MSTITALNGYSLNVLNVNLSNELTYWQGTNIQSNTTVGGINYPSVYGTLLYINGIYYNDVFGGNFTTNSSKAITSGSVSAYYELIWTGNSWYYGVAITDFTYSAVAFYNAAISGSQAATNNIVTNLMSGSDTITGSFGDDILKGFGGNDTINGGGGTDASIYVGSFSSYKIFKNLDGSITVSDQRNEAPDGTDILSN